MTTIPYSHRDLIDGPYVTALATVGPDGQPQVTPVWCNRCGNCVLINTMKGFRKEKNMRLNRRVSLLAYDPCHPERHIEIRGCVVEMSEDGARQHLNEVAELYMSKPAALELAYTPIRATFAPTRIRVEGQTVRQPQFPPAMAICYKGRCTGC